MGSRLSDLAEGLQKRKTQPDVASMVWPLVALLIWSRRRLLVFAALILLAAPGFWPSHVNVAGRVAAMVAAAWVVSVALRLLIPAGPLPWRCLRLVRRWQRWGVLVGLASVVTSATLFIWYAVTGSWAPAAIAILSTALVGVCALAAQIGADTSQPGFSHELVELLAELRELKQEAAREFHQLMQEARQEFRELKQDSTQDFRERKQQLERELREKREAP